jgi:hypothetical protein
MILQKLEFRRFLILVLLGLPFFLILLFTYVLPPPLPVEPGTGVDSSWQVMLTEAFLRSAQFGREVIFTYGPWGFLDRPRGDPRIYPWLAGARLLMAVAFVFGSSLLAMRHIRRPGMQWIFLAWVMFPGDPLSVTPMVLLAVALPRGTDKEWGTTGVSTLLAVACALTVWGKFTSFVMIGALAAALATYDLVKRRLPLVSLEIVAGAIGFWLLAGQSLSNMPAYVKGALSIAGSYSEEMFLRGPDWEVGFVAGLALVIAIPSAIVFFCRKEWLLLPALIWVALQFFVQFKEAFVRHDPQHVWMGIVTSLFPCSMIFLCWTGFFDWETLRPQTSRRTFILVRGCAAGTVLLSPLFIFLELQVPGGNAPIGTLARNLSSVAALGPGSGMSADYRHSLEEFRRREPLGEIPGTAAFFPDNQAVLYGHGLQVRLAPVPQAFLAYNAVLTKRNGSFFRSGNRPDFVLFDIHPIDNRYPSASDTSSWLALMACYEPSRYAGHYLLLQAAKCSDTHLELIAETKTTAGTRVAVPVADGYPVWAQIDTRLNTMGSIVKALARSPETDFAVDTPRERHVFRLSPGNARTGFLLSPMMFEPVSLGLLLSEGVIDPRADVRGITIIQSTLTRRLSEPSIGIRF